MSEFYGNFEVYASAIENMKAMGENTYWWFIGGMEQADSQMEDNMLYRELARNGFRVAAIHDMNGDFCNWTVQ